jgi:hypothetical protein
MKVATHSLTASRLRVLHINTAPAFASAASRQLHVAESGRTPAARISSIAARALQWQENSAVMPTLVNRTCWSESRKVHARKSCF